LPLLHSWKSIPKGCAFCHFLFFFFVLIQIHSFLSPSLNPASSARHGRQHQPCLFFPRTRKCLPPRFSSPFSSSSSRHCIQVPLSFCNSDSTTATCPSLFFSFFFFPRRHLIHSSPLFLFAGKGAIEPSVLFVRSRGGLGNQPPPPPLWRPPWLDHCERAPFFSPPFESFFFLENFRVKGKQSCASSPLLSALDDPASSSFFPVGSVRTYFCPFFFLLRQLQLDRDLPSFFFFWHSFYEDTVEEEGDKSLPRGARHLSPFSRSLCPLLGAGPPFPLPLLRGVPIEDSFRGASSPLFFFRSPHQHEIREGYSPFRLEKPLTYGSAVPLSSRTGAFPFVRQNEHWLPLFFPRLQCERPFGPFLILFFFVLPPVWVREL